MDSKLINNEDMKPKQRIEETEVEQVPLIYRKLSGRRHSTSEKTSINDPAKVKTFKKKRGKLSHLFDEYDPYEDIFNK